MWLLVAKLVLVPTIVVATTLVGRRFGAAVSGWLVALPLMSGPITCFLAIEHGRMFAAHVSIGSLSGTLGEAAFCLGWAATARRRSWRVALLAGSLSFAAAGLLTELLPLGPRLDVLIPLAGAGVVALAIALRLVPEPPFEAVEVVRPHRFELPARAVAATAILLTITALATMLGARLSGLLTVYPLYTAVLASFALRGHGPATSLRVLRGLLAGLFAFDAFFASLAFLLPRASIATSFTVALILALTIHAATLWPLRHAGRHAESAPAAAPA